MQLLILPQNAIATVSMQGASVINSQSGSQSTNGTPTGFTDDVIVADISGDPTSLALLPDGRLLVAAEDGQVRVVASDGTLLGTPALNLLADGIICNDGERGLESIIVDPDFANNQRVYIYHTFNNAGTCINRVVRYTFTPANLMTNPVVILTNLASPCTNHNGGDLNFGADGLLYVSVGDGGCTLPGVSTNNARYLSVLNGKILRINTDGSIPATNPFANTPGAVQCGLNTFNPAGGNCKEIFAFGFRNPFRTAFKTGSNQLYVNDVGQSLWEEIDNVTAGSAGAPNDYGWYCREGKQAYTTCNPAPTNPIDPIYDYAHAAGLFAITGGAFAVSGGVWPAPYDDSYFFADYGGSTIYRLVPGSLGSPYSAATFASSPSGGQIIDMMWDANADALYYSLYSGQVRRIRYTAGGNRAPTAVAAGNPTSGAAPLSVNFSSTGSNDPDGDAITYGWTFGDGGTSTQANPSHTYNTPGVFTAALVVTDSHGAASAPSQVTINPGNTPPTVQITSPSASARFSVGQVLTLVGSASDAQDGDVTSSLQWTVLLVHVSSLLPGNQHTHPFFSGSGNNLTMPTAPSPEDYDAAALSYLQVSVTARDSQGLQTTVTQRLDPQRATLTFGTLPAGLQISLNGASINTTKVISTWQGQQIQLAAPTSQVGSDGKTYTFSSWSDGGQAAHTLTAPGTDTAYIASFVATNPPNTPPTVQINAPTTSARFAVSQVYTLTGSATDTQDGDLSNHMVWKVDMVNISSATPGTQQIQSFYSGTGNNLRLPPMPAPKDLDSAALSYLRIQVTVSDTQGMTATVSQTLQPQRASLTFNTQPAGLRIDVGGTAITGSKVISAWQGQSLQLVAPSFQQSNGKNYIFGSWSDGGQATHAIGAPGTNATYTATFAETTNTPPVAQIISPTNNPRFTVGQVFTLIGSATDAQDGDLSNRIAWIVNVVRPSTEIQTIEAGTPFFSGTGKSVTLPPLPSPTDLDTAQFGYLQIQMIVTDLQGLPTVVTQILEPKRTALTFNTQPSGLRLDVLGTSITATKTISAWQGQSLQFSAPYLQLASNGKYYKFATWVDAAAQIRTIAVTDVAASYTATFTEVSDAQLKKTYVPLIAR